VAPVAAVCAPPQADLSAENIENVNGETILRGKAALVDVGILLTADEIRINQSAQTGEASGHVTLTQLGERMLADKITFNRAARSYIATNIRIGKFPFYIEGPRAEGHLSRQGDPGEVVIHDATITYGEPSSWQPTVKAKTLFFSPGHYMRIVQADLGIGSYRPLPFASMVQDLAKKTGLAGMTLEGGYRHSLGPYLDSRVSIPVEPGFSIGPDVGLYTFRGLMVGPSANYDITSGDDLVQGSLRAGYIYDFGSRNTDILDNPVPPSRAFIEWRHDQQLTPDLTINGAINWSSDSEVIRDFHPRDFIPVQEPDNFLEAVYTGADFFASAFTRFQPDAFYPVQERLPEIRFDLVPTLVGGGIYVRFDTGLAHLEENPPDGGSHLEYDRFDTFLGVSRPFSYKGILDVTPVAGGRFTEYWGTQGAAEAGGTGRALGELGFDADLKMSGMWNYKNELIGIDGIRHLLTPTLSYRYIPNANKSTDWIPQIDRETFSNYLPVMDLGDMRALDQLQAENVLRVGLNNTIETRDKSYGSRELLSFDVEDDFRYQRTPGETDFSDVFAELRVTPAHWLELRFEDTVSTQGAGQRARDASIIFRGAEVWSIELGTGFLSDKFAAIYLPGLGAFPIEGLDTYHAEFRTRLNEQYEAFARGDYDYRMRQFVDEFYGVTQRVSNTWTIEYAVVFSNGPNKGQGHFGLNVSLNLVRF